MLQSSIFNQKLKIKIPLHVNILLLDHFIMYYTEQIRNQKFIIKYGVSSIKAFHVHSEEQYEALLRVKDEPIKYLICHCNWTITLERILNDFPDLELFESKHLRDMGALEKIPDRIIYLRAPLSLHVRQLGANLRYLHLEALDFDQTIGHALPAHLKHLETGLTIQHTIIPAQTVMSLNNMLKVDLDNQYHAFRVAFKRESKALFDHVQFITGDVTNFVNALQNNIFHFVVPWNEICSLKNIQMSIGSWPTSLTSLKMTFGCLIEFLPQGLKKLNVSAKATCAELIMTCLPISLEYLSITSYNNTLYLPENLEYLKMYEYNHEPLSFPDTLKVMYLPKYNHKIIEELPSTLEIMYLPRYNHDIPSLPRSLRVININACERY